MAILLTAMFHLFKIKLHQVKIQLIKIQLKTKYMDPTLNGSAINLTLAICQMKKSLMLLILSIGIETRQNTYLS